MKHFEGLSSVSRVAGEPPVLRARPAAVTGVSNRSGAKLRACSVRLAIGAIMGAAATLFGCSVEADGDVAAPPSGEEAVAPSSDALRTESFSWSTGTPAAVPFALVAHPRGEGVYLASVRFDTSSSLRVEKIQHNGTRVWAFERKLQQQGLGDVGQISAAVADDGTVFVAGRNHLYAVRSDGKAFRWVRPRGILFGDQVGLAWDRTANQLVAAYAKLPAPNSNDAPVVLQRIDLESGNVMLERADLATDAVGIGSVQGAVALPNGNVAVAANNRVFLFGPRFELRARTGAARFSRTFDNQGSIAYSPKDNTIVVTFGEFDFVSPTAQSGVDVVWKLRADDLQPVWTRVRRPPEPGRAYELNASVLADGRIVLAGRQRDMRNAENPRAGLFYEVRDINGFVRGQRLFAGEATTDNRNVAAIRMSTFVLSGSPQFKDVTIRRIAP
jgi:hypothetical protein